MPSHNQRIINFNQMNLQMASVLREFVHFYNRIYLVTEAIIIDNSGWDNQFWLPWACLGIHHPKSTG